MTKGKSNRFYDFIIRVLRLMLALVARIEVRGLHNIPRDGGVIVVANHVSHIDPLIMGMTLRRSGRRVRAMAKDSLFKVPVVGSVFVKMGHIPVYRNSNRAVEALSSAVEALNAGEAIGMYPEGTVPKNNERLGVFKTGAARLALTSNAVIIPVAQIGAQEILPIRGKIARHVLASIVRRKKVTIHIGSPIILDFPDPNPEDREQVNLVNERLFEEISALLAIIE